MIECKPASTLVDINVKFGKGEESHLVDKESFQRLIGQLIYLNHTCLSISFAKSSLSKFMGEPYENPLQVARQIPSYLKNTIRQGLLFTQNGNFPVTVYIDVDYVSSVWVEDPLEDIELSWFSSLITCHSKKQKVVARSSIEVEFYAMAHGIGEVIWAKIILEELKSLPWEGIRLYCHNKSSRAIAQNPIQHEKTKHIEID